MNNAIFELADRLKSAKETKKELELQVKELTAQIEQMDQELSQAMTEAECDKFSRNGSIFYLNTIYCTI